MYNLSTAHKIAVWLYTFCVQQQYQSQPQPTHTGTHTLAHAQRARYTSTWAGFCGMWWPSAKQPRKVCYEKCAIA